MARRRSKKGQAFYRPPLGVVQRLVAQLQVEEKKGCWLWQGSSSGGYGQISINGKPCWVHRVAYAIWNEVIPDEMDVHHLCYKTLCCNPEHLRAIPRDENVSDGNVHRKNAYGQTYLPRSDDDEVPF